VRSRELAHRGRREVAHVGRLGYFFGPGCATRTSLECAPASITPSLARLARHETGAHRAIVERVGKRYQKHALMVRHVGAYDRNLLAFRQTGFRVIERFVETVGSPATLPREAVKICSAAPGSTIAASAVAYGAITKSSLRPRLSPSPGTPKLEY